MSRADAAGDGVPAGLTQRLDKWLWFARVAKTRTLAAALVTGGKIRVNRVRVDKPSQAVRVGDVITSAAARQVRVLKIAGLGERRGPPAAARLLFEELTAPDNHPNSRPRADEPAVAPAAATRDPGTGRPTKRDRRAIDRFRGESSR